MVSFGKTHSNMYLDSCAFVLIMLLSIKDQFSKWAMVLKCKIDTIFRSHSMFTNLFLNSCAHTNLRN